MPALLSSDMGNNAYNAEDLLVRVYEDSWVETDLIVPDQVTPASDNIPLEESGTGVAGTSNEYSRRNHMHPSQVSDVLPTKDTATGEEEVATTYARSDHTHHVIQVKEFQKKDSRTGTAGTTNIYSCATPQHPLNIDPTTANFSLVNATAATNGIGNYYCRNDQVHPQQLTYVGNITKTKFIKTDGTYQQILFADGTTKPIYIQPILKAQLNICRIQKQVAIPRAASGALVQ
ncbi:MAG: hypothetical protein EZS28_017250 [Streblomastix strix]|uniref:Uncharacterized protein n=1 Tax=Streblomastix strix TaxID=222440 RepID=A0A5J4VY01_9EUKA|nr:MAG: hypothetical protein EZS28_017250 [Streblomastix strix]